MRRATSGIFAAVLLGAVSMMGTAFAQDRDQTLADIRQELSVLFVDIQRLKRELSTTGSPQVGTGGVSVLDRVNAIEAELARLTAQTEQLEFRLNRVVTDGTNRIGDLEFRLCELEPSCDIASLGDTPTLGGGALPEAPVTGAVASPAVPAEGPQLAANERADFERASEALAQGDFRAAADQFASFNQTYPGGPLGVAADLRRGEALDGLGDTREAARAYLNAFRLDQTGPLAAEALFRLGRALGALGQTNEACVTLGEVGVRFPTAEAVAQANEERLRIGCS